MDSHIQPCLHIAIPAMDELEWLPRTLACAASQRTKHPFSLHICVNQPDDWWGNPQKVAVCRSNARLMSLVREFAESHPEIPVSLIDRSSPGCGWKGKHFGVGWARKVLFDSILCVAHDDDLIVSMDADTEFSPTYLESVAASMGAHPQWNALSVPYYHKAVADVAATRAMLRYEIFMRNYALNMLAIGSPYSFTAVGSAIAIRIGALRKIGGITPMKSGEDFYLLQKLRKMGEVGTWNSEPVFPAARFSDRVFFGTGPAMAKGSEGDWTSYPIYHHSLFVKVADTYKILDRLAVEDVSTEFVGFLQAQFKEKDLWQPLRQNVKERSQFVRAFHEKADGLRILQFLKSEQKREDTADALVLQDNLLQLLGKEEYATILPYFSSGESLAHYPTAALSGIREVMYAAEMRVRRGMA